MARGRRTDSPSVFYGWFVVAAIFVVLTVTAGLGFYNASVILRQSKEELEASVSAVSGATAVFFGVSGLVGFLLSRMMERVDLRRFYYAGAVLGAGALLGLRWVDSVVELYAFFVLFGVAFATAGLVPSTTIVARWFDKRRSIALSVASTGLSFGGIVLTPATARFIEARSLAEAGPWLAVVWFVGIAPISAVLIRSWPSDKGLEPDGAPRRLTPVAVQGATFAQARRTRFFVLISATYAMVFLAQVGGIAQLYNLVSERVDSSVAATALSVMALSSVIGRLAGGLLVSVVSTRSMTIGLTVVQAVALTLLARADGSMSIYIVTAVFGLSIGNLLMLQPLLLVETFGVKEYSRIYSFCQLFGTIGVAGGPFLIGALRDIYDYEIALYFAASANLVAIATLLLAGPTQAGRATWDPAATAQ